MALIAEEIVEEWLNRQGYFTIRGIKLGYHEIDILAIRPRKEGGMECRHVEAQCSMRPVGYITTNNARAQERDELVANVKKWVNKKFNNTNKAELKKQLCSYDWTNELVINVVRSADEVKQIKKQGVIIHELKDIVADLENNTNLVKSASGADLVDLIVMGANICNIEEHR